MFRTRCTKPCPAQKLRIVSSMIRSCDEYDSLRTSGNTARKHMYHDQPPSHTSQSSRRVACHACRLRSSGFLHTAAAPVQLLQPSASKGGGEAKRQPLGRRKQRRWENGGYPPARRTAVWCLPFDNKGSCCACLWNLFSIFHGTQGNEIVPPLYFLQRIGFGPPLAIVAG